MNIKVDFLITNLISGGAERVMVVIANYLVDKGYNVSIITIKDGDEFELDDRINRVCLHSRQDKITNHFIRSIYNLREYYQNKNNRPDVLISYTTTINLIAIIVAKLCKLKVIVSEHNNYLRNLNKRAKFTKEYIYKYANLLTVLTSYDVEYYKKHKARVMIMPNPCSFKSIEGEDLIRDKILLAVGSLNRYHHKGFDNLIKIVKPILKDKADWKLKIVGRGDIKLIQKLVIEAGIQEQVEFTGFSNNISQIMRQSDIYILSSRYEGLPMVLLEAMSQGMSCIAYNCKTGPSDIIEDKVNGLLIEDQNIDQMQMELKRMINNKDLRNELRQNAIRVTDKYSVELIGEKWEKAISSTING